MMLYLFHAADPPNKVALVRAFVLSLPCTDPGVKFQRSISACKGCALAYANKHDFKADALMGDAKLGR
jgi:hypothetical protein